MTPTPTQMERLLRKNYIFIADGSSSMAEDAGGANAGTTRWDVMQEWFGQCARDISKIDSDGIGIVLFHNGKIITRDNQKPADITALFAGLEPRGSTPMAEALEEAIKMGKAGGKEFFISAWTDGVPDNKEKVAQLITKQAESQKTVDECKIQFVQVGNVKEASRYLEDLDDDLHPKNGLDIVDVVKFADLAKFETTEELLLKSLDD